MSTRFDLVWKSFVETDQKTFSRQLRLFQSRTDKRICKLISKGKIPLRYPAR